MQCNICFRRHHATKLPFLCAFDARSQLYQPRLRHAHALLENDALDRQICADILARQDGNDDDVSSGTSRWMMEESDRLSSDIDARTDKILLAAEKLKASVASARADLARKKKNLSQRKEQHAANKKSNIEAKEIKRLEDIKKSTKMVTYKWHQNHASTINARALLTMEAANLYGLQRLHGLSSSSRYQISNVPIFDLRAMCSNAKAVEITASLTQVAQLLVLVTHYLAIKLPCEITLPHRDYPLATIFKLKDSYKMSDPHFPGHEKTSRSLNNSPTSSRHDDSSRRPSLRPLYINKPLPMLHKEDVLMFLEGVSFLAYNIAWACKTQSCGVGTSSESAPVTVEDVCDIGGNLYRLLVTKPTSSRHSTVTTSPQDRAEDVNAQVESTSVPLGHFSHGLAHDSLGTKSGLDYQKSFKLPTTTAINDYLRAHIMSEIEGTGWTLVEDEVAMDEQEGFDEEDGVLVNGKTKSANNKDEGDADAKRRAKKRAARDKVVDINERKALSDFGAASFMSMQTVATATTTTTTTTTETAREGDVRRGNKGWTLVKDRI